MDHLESRQALEEFLRNVQERDLVKARYVLRHIGEVQPAAQKRILFELSRSDLHFALPLLTQTLIQCPDLLAVYPTLKDTYRDKLLQAGSLAFSHLFDALNSGDSELQAFALQLLGETGEERAKEPIRRLLTGYPQDARVRAAAYEALERIGLDKGGLVVARGLSDPVREVRLAAAGALERQAGPSVIQGLQNMIADKDEEAEQAVQALLEAKAARIFRALLDDPSFWALCLKALNGPEMGGLRGWYAELCREQGRQEAAKALSGRGGRRDN